MIAIVPATAEHIRAIYGADLACSVRALAVVDETRVLGVAGTYQAAGKTVMFSNMVDDMRHYPRAMLTVARRLQANCDRQVFAVCDTTIPRAAAFLEHVGFNKINDEVYVWQRQSHSSRPR